VVAGPVATLYKDIGEQTSNHFARRKVIEDHDGVHGFQRGKNFGAFAFRKNRATFPFQLAHTCIAIQPNDQCIPQFAR